jgi:penicillin-binding protein 1C
MRWRRRLRRLVIAAAGMLCLGWLAFAVAVRWRPYPIALLLPGPAASLTVVDADGRPLRQQATAVGGRETWVPLDRISPHLLDATLAAEDHHFFRHHGYDLGALARAAWLDVRARRAAYGGSTLTMQLTRLLERRSRGLGAKLSEMVLAARLERQISKRQILEQYLNRVYYGNGAWGAEAAARLYFGKPAAALSVGEAAFLAVLPRGPEAYHPFRHLAQALARRSHILDLMVAQRMLSPEDRRLVEIVPLRLLHERPGFAAPHFVDYALGELDAAERSGGVIVTTLDRPLQERVEVAVREHLDQVAWLHITQAAVVVMRNSDGAILALVGSRDWFDAEHSGAESGVTARRRPGSTLKPFVYGLAIERGDTPATLAYDVVLPRDVHQRWTQDVRQHGPARYRESLAGSYNLAAVHTLERVGPDRLLQRLRQAGLSTLDRPDERYGPDLAIGEAEVRLSELTAAFAAFGNGGVPIVPHAVVAVESGGRRRERPAAPVPGPLYSPPVAWSIWDILSDPDARRPMFGDRVPMNLPFPVALKTGTTRGYTDNWALGTTREFTVGVWAGNFDGSPTHGVMSVRGATPLVRAVMVALAARFGVPTAPARPAGLVVAEVCALSGQAPGPFCTRRKQEVFLEGRAPNQTCSWHRLACGRPVVDYPPEVQGWLRARHRLPERPDCAELAADRAAGLRILYPVEGARFLIDPHRPRADQLPPLEAAPRMAAVRWTIDGVPASRWRPSPGRHRIRAQLAGQSDQVSVQFD